MDIDIDSSLFQLDQSIEYGYCTNCHRKDQMIQKYVKLVTLYRQKLKLNGLRSRTLQGWHPKDRKKESTDKKYMRTADTNFTWKQEIIERQKLFEKEVLEQQPQQSSVRVYKNDVSDCLLKKVNEKVQELKSFIAHVRSTVYYLLEALDLNSLQKTNPKIGTQHFKALVNVLISSFEFDEEERHFIYQHQGSFGFKMRNKNRSRFALRRSEQAIKNRGSLTDQGRLSKIIRIFGLTF